MQAVLEWVAAATQEAERIIAAEGEDPKTVAADFRSLAGHIKPLPASLKEMVELTRANWSKIALPLRTQAIQISQTMAEFTAILKRTEILAPVIGADEAAEFTENAHMVMALSLELQRVIGECVATEKARADELTGLVISSSPGGIDGIRQRVNKARAAFKAGRFKRFSAEQLLEKARNCSQ